VDTNAAWFAEVFQVGLPHILSERVPRRVQTAQRDAWGPFQMQALFSHFIFCIGESITSIQGFSGQWGILFTSE